MPIVVSASDNDWWASTNNAIKNLQSPELVDKAAFIKTLDRITYWNSASRSIIRQAKIFPLIISCLQDISLESATLSLLSNLALDVSTRNELLSDQPFMLKVVDYLDSEKTDIKISAGRILSHIAFQNSGRRDAIVAISDSIIRRLMKYIFSVDLRIQEIGVYALGPLAWNVNARAMLLADEGLISRLIAFLKTKDTNLERYTVPMITTIIWENPLLVRRVIDLGIEPVLDECRKNNTHPSIGHDIAILTLHLYRIRREFPASFAGGNDSAVHTDSFSLQRDAFFQKNKGNVASVKLTAEERLKAIQYNGEIDPRFICPISHEVMDDPVTVSNGQTYDRASLRRYAESSKDPETQEIPAILLCPLTRQPFKAKEIDNRTTIIVKQLIDDFVDTKEKEAKVNHKIKGFGQH